MTYELEAAQHSTPRARFTEVQRVNTFVFAGNATLTLRSAKTGARFTYRVRESDDGRVFFVSVLTGSDNEGDFTYLGLFRAGVYEHGRKSRVSATAPSAVAFEFFGREIRKAAMNPALEVWHEGRCGRCNRKLTVPESIASGFGPECVGKIACSEV